MSAPLPLTNQCPKCKEWFHSVHICPRDIRVMPAKCPTATACRQHGCHGECLAIAQQSEEAMSANLPPLPEPAQPAQSSGYMPGCPIEIAGTPDFYTADQMCTHATEALSTQAAELESLRADAERYRWLRDKAWGQNGALALLPPSEMDAAIDQARAAMLAARSTTPARGPHVTTAAELKQQAKSDMSCVGAFARARPPARTKE